MAVKWTEVLQNPKYQTLSDGEKSKVKDRYFQNVVSKNEKFVALSDQDKESVRARFYNSPVEKSFFQKTKEFLIDKPSEGAKVLREAGADTISPTHDSIMKQSEATGKVPYGKIAGRVAAETLMEQIPLTPTDLALTATGALPAVKGIIPKGLKAAGATISRKSGEQVVKNAVQALPESIVDPAKKLTKDFFGQQLDRFKVSDDAKQIFAETSEAFKTSIDKARRGKIDWKGTEKLADELGMTTKDLIKRNKGQAFNAEQLEAAKALVGESLERVNKIRQAYAANPNMESLTKLNSAIAEHQVVQSSFMGARAEAGRALQILRKVTDPSETVNKNFQAMLDAAGGEKIAKEIADRLAKIDPSDIAGVNKFIRDVSKAKTSEQIYEYWINSILSSPMTHKANVIGNTLFTLFKVPEKITRGVVDATASVITKKRTAFSGEATKEMFSIARGFTDGLRRGLHALVKGSPQDAVSKLEVSHLPAIKGKVGEIIRIPSRMLVAEDEFAKAVVGRMETAAQAYRKAKFEGLRGKSFAKRIAELEANPTDDILKAVQNEKLLRTFQNRDNKAIQSLLNLRKEVPGLKYILPFIQTPFNITMRAAERSPLGAIKVLHSIAKKKGQEEIVKDISNFALGSAISTGIAFKAIDDKLTGPPPKDAADRDKFYRSGKQPWSVKVGDKWYSYARLEPLSLVLGMTAHVVNTAKENDNDINSNVAQAMVMSVPQYLQEQSFLSGLRDVMDAVDDPARYGQKWVLRQAGTIVPFSAFNRFIAQQIDDVIRTPSTVGEAIKANVPGLSKSVTPKLNALGDRARRQNDLFSTLLTRRTTEVVDPIDKEDEKLDRKLGFPGRHMAGVKLKPREYNRLLRVSGQTFKKSRRILQTSEEWKQSSPDDRNGILDTLQRESRRMGKREVYLEVLKRIPNKPKVTEEFVNYGLNTLGIKRSEIINILEGKKKQ